MRPRLKNISNNNTLQINYLFLKIVIRRNKKISHHLWFSDLKKFNYKVFSRFTLPLSILTLSKLSFFIKKNWFIFLIYWTEKNYTFDFYIFEFDTLEVDILHLCIMYMQPLTPRPSNANDPFLKIFLFWEVLPIVVHAASIQCRVQSLIIVNPIW